MKLTTAHMVARLKAGYHPPEDNPLVCANCGAIRLPRGDFKPYFCRRHGFYVHSHGYCPFFSKECYEEPPPRPRSPFTQQDLAL